MPWLRAPEAAAHLGVSARTVANRANRGEIEYREVGRGHREYLIGDAPVAPLRESAPVSADRDALETLAARASGPAPKALRSDERRRETELGCWVSDVHIPDHDVRAVSTWLEWVAYAQPDVIVLGGDIVELESCSSHGGIAQPASLLEDCEAGEAFLRQVRKVAGDECEIVYVGGNHEDRLRRITVAQAPTLAGSLDLRSLLCLDEIGISYVPYPGVYDRGQMRFFHGRYHNIHHAKKHLEDEHHRPGHIVYGHTHRPQSYTVGLRGGAHATAWGAGCLRTLDPLWRLGKGGHAHGFLTWESDGEIATPALVGIDQGRLVWRGRRFG